MYHILEWLSDTLLKGISDTPAWIVARANQYARLTGKTPFVVYQGAWSILQRDFERDIIPMARAEGQYDDCRRSKHSLNLLYHRYGPCSVERSRGWPYPHR